MNVHCLTFNPMSENTYLLADPDTREAVLIDPGCYGAGEEQHLKQYLRKHRLELSQVLLTHAHLDHIFGCEYVYRSFGLMPRMHPLEVQVWDDAPQRGMLYGFPFELPDRHPTPIEIGETIKVGAYELLTRFVPGHSPGSVAFYCATSGFVVAGDTLFRNSIGRTDFTGGHLPTLLTSITRELLTLPDATVVYSGHGASTTVGAERANNPFLK